MTKVELARRMGKSRQALDKQLKGKLLVETAQEIADAIGIPIAELFSERSEPTIVCPCCGKVLKIKVE